MVNRRLRGVPYVLLIQDVWPDSILASGFLPGAIGGFARVVINWFVNRSYRSSAALIVTSPGMRELLTSRGVPTNKITLAYNWVEAERSALAAPSQLRDSLGLTADDFLLMYAGNHGGAQALDAVVRAFGEIPAERRCHLLLVGGGIEKPALLRQAAGIDRVHFLDPQPRAVVEQLMTAADAQLVSLADHPLFRVTTPSKLQAVMAAGHPVIVHATGDAAQIVREAVAGIAVSSGDRAALTAAVVEMSGAPSEKRRQWGENGRAYYETHMAEVVGVSRMFDVLQLAAQTRSKRLGNRQHKRRKNAG
jgi:glycosyltransferase involved in cell wall biosynthesis